MDNVVIGDLEDLGLAAGLHNRASSGSQKRQEFETLVQPSILTLQKREQKKNKKAAAELVIEREHNDGVPASEPVSWQREQEDERLIRSQFGGEEASEVEEGEDARPVGYDIPGSQRVYLKTYGCSHNSSDSEYMAGLLAEQGYELTEDFSKADVYLMNSCTVKNPSQDSFFNLVDKAKVTGKPVIVAGCVPQGQPSNPSLEGLSVIGVQQIDRVVEVVEQAVKGNTVRFMGRSNKREQMPRLDLPKVRRNRYVEIVPINLGCLNSCTYCKTKHARGNLLSYPVEEIVDRVKQTLDEGVMEIRITSEDTGAYGRDIDSDLPTLLRELAGAVPDGAMLRVGMTNPPYILEHLDAIAEILNHPNVYSFLHVPVQSGSSRVLKAMAREYTREDFIKVVETLMAKVPGISIATDIICGFPGETEEEFEETLDLIDKYRFPIVNISQFYPRPGTPAARMKRVPTAAVKDRSRRLTRLFESYQTYASLVGTEQRVWITELAADGRNLVGHTKGFVQVLIDPSEAEMGCDAIVKITEAGKWSVNGKVISTHQRPVLATSTLSLRKRATVKKPSKSSSETSPEVCNTCGEAKGSCSTNSSASSNPTTTVTASPTAATPSLPETAAPKALSEEEKRPLWAKVVVSILIGMMISLIFSGFQPSGTTKI